MFTNKTRALLLLVLMLAAAGALAGTATGGQEATAGSRFISKAHGADLECAQCHACENPTKEDPCMVGCPRHHGHFHSDARPDDGPDVVMIGELANLYDPVPFSHSLHATMSDMIGGCENCHHYGVAGEPIQPCKECHDPAKSPVNLTMPSLKGAYHRQCMNCHLDWSHEKACNFCHHKHEEGAPVPEDPTDIVGVQHPLIEATSSYYYNTSYEKGPIVSFHHTDHVEKFGLNCVDCHSGDSCARCHDQKSERTVPAGHITGSKGSCTSCHAERSCDFCHDTQRKPEFNHATSVGWDLGERHEDLACIDCHGTPKEFHLPMESQCMDCHSDWHDPDFDHGAVTGAAFSEDHEGLDCGDCHQTGNFYEEPTCDGCHDDDRKYDPRTGFGG